MLMVYVKRGRFIRPIRTLERPLTLTNFAQIHRSGLPSATGAPRSFRHSKPSPILVEHDFRALFDAFIKDRQRPGNGTSLSAKTVRSYRQAHAAFDSAWDATDERKMREALLRNVDAKVNGPKATLQASGMNVYIRGLNAFLSWCVECGFSQQDLRLKLLPLPQRQRPKVLNEVQIEQWKKFRCVNLTQLRVKYLVMLILDTGLRAEESLGLTVSDIEWAASRLWTNTKGRIGKREVPVSTEGKRLLRKFLALTHECRETEDKEMEPMFSYLFCTELGRQTSYRNSLRDLKKIAKVLGMEWVGWHTFRRTFGTQYLRNGGLVTDLQEIYGHRDLRTTILYLGSSIDEIVALHDKLSPLSPRSGGRK